MFKTKKLIIFDCDGVLFDSHTANREFLLHCLNQVESPPLTEQELDKATYLSVQQFIDLLDIPEKTYLKLMDITRSAVFTPFIPHMHPIVEFDTFLPPLKQRFYLSIASNRSRSLQEVIRHFGLERYFHYFISTLDAAPKPDPEMLTMTCAHFSLHVSDALYVGDSVVDAEAAARAGMDFLWIGDIRESPSISSLADLPRLLEADTSNI